MCGFKQMTVQSVRFKLCQLLCQSRKYCYMGTKDSRVFYTLYNDVFDGEIVTRYICF